MRNPEEIRIPNDIARMDRLSALYDSYCRQTVSSLPEVVDRRQAVPCRLAPTVLRRAARSATA